MNKKQKAELLVTGEKQNTLAKLGLITLGFATVIALLGLSETKKRKKN